MADPSHAPVLPEESLALLAPAPSDVIVDCTAGRGGHARLLAEQLDASGTIVLLDVDSGNLEFAHSQLAQLPCTVHAVHGSFGLAHRSVVDLGLKANVVLADLGFASNQMDDPQRGLGFRHDGH